jgi:hypothetical protein
MAKNISPTVAERFMQDCYAVLRTIQDCSRGEKVLALPRPTNLPKNALQDKLELEAVNLQLVITGWEYLKITNGLLKDKQKRCKAQLCANSTQKFVKLFCVRCWVIKATMEESCPSLGRKKQSHW